MIGSSLVSVRRTLRFTAAGLVCVALSTAGCSSGTAADTGGGGGRGGGRGGRGGRGGGAQPVVVATVGHKDVPIDIAAVGNVEAYTMIAVRSQVTGQLEEVFIHEGDFVKKGAPLFTIDRRPFEAALQQAQANLVRDQALLNQAEAQLARDAANAEYQQLVAERQASLVGRGIISKDAGEQARAQADATNALVKADKANIEGAKAQLVAQESMVENAKVQLSYTRIASPIDGRLGDVTVKAGNLVTANNTQLMTIAQVEPILVTFAVPAVHLPTIKKHTGEKEKLTVVATPQDADAQPATGTLTFVDNIVDQTTDTIKLKATFTNDDRRLWPGQFARVTLRLAMLSNATVVPQQAVQTGQDGQFVFVVKADQTVDQRPIVAGQRVSDDVVIEKGLEPGEVIVTEGQLRLEQGTRIQTSDPNGNTQGGRGGRGGRGGGRGGRRGGNQGEGQGGDGAQGAAAGQGGAAGQGAGGRRGE